jgi:hypothetical protein
MLPSLALNSSRAAEWSIEPSVDLRGEYNDNFELTSGPHSTVWGLILSPDVKFSGTTETFNVTGGLRVNLNRYFGEQGLDTTDYISSLRSTYKTERDVWGLNVDAVRDSTLVSELFETGVALARRQRTRLAANPSWSRSLTEATAIIASYSYSDVHYADTGDTSLIDYSDQTATVGFQSNLSERDVASLTAYYDRYETKPSQSLATTYGIQAGYDCAFSETLHGNLVVGARQTRSTVSAQALVCDGPIFSGICLGNLTLLTETQSETSTGWTLLAALDKKWETAQLSARLSREINPSGVGALVETDRAGIFWNHQWSPTVSYSVDAAIYQSRYVGNIVSGSDSRYYHIEPRVSWKITEWWTLTGGYSYSHTKSTSSPLEASANVVYLVLNYTWPKLSVSR